MRNLLATIEQKDFRPWICAALLFVISFPKWFWGMGAGVITFATYLLIIVAYKDMSHNKRWSAGILAFILQQYIVFTTDIHHDTNLNGYIMVLIKGLGFATLFFCSADFWKKTVDCFTKLLSILLVPAIIEHIMIAFLNMPLTESTYIEECPINPEREYNGYLFNVYLLSTLEFVGSFRFLSFYDEPGVLGNITMVLLYIQRFNLKKWYNFVLLVSGILSFSLTFYVAVAAYYILFGNFKLKMTFLIVVAIATIYFYNNEIVYDLVFKRVEFENGSLAGYNRELHSDIDAWLKRVSIFDFFFWGFHPRDGIPYAASWKWAFALWGIVPCVLYVFSVAFPFAKYLKGKKDVISCIVLIVIIWIQRPFVYLYFYAFLVAIPIIYFVPYRNVFKEHVVKKSDCI